MNIFIKKVFLLFLVVVFTQSCSTAVTVVDNTTSAAINTVKGVVHYTTCPFTKKECF
jgi:cbb3-type cytochrome oxidase cytochrome c subunit